MNTAIINVKVEPITKRKARRVAEDLGLSLSGLVNGLLKQVIRTKTVTLSVSDEEPTEYMLKALKESSEDIKRGRVISFENGADAIKYFKTKLIVDEKKSRKN